MLKIIVYSLLSVLSNLIYSFFLPKINSSRNYSDFVAIISLSSFLTLAFSGVFNQLVLSKFHFKDYSYYHKKLVCFIEKQYIKQFFFASLIFIFSVPFFIHFDILIYVLSIFYFFVSSLRIVIIAVQVGIYSRYQRVLILLMRDIVLKCILIFALSNIHCSYYVQFFIMVLIELVFVWGSLNVSMKSIKIQNELKLEKLRSLFLLTHRERSLSGQLMFQGLIMNGDKLLLGFFNRPDSLTSYNILTLFLTRVPLIVNNILELNFRPVLLRSKNLEWSIVLKWLVVIVLISLANLFLVHIFSKELHTFYNSDLNFTSFDINLIGISFLFYYVFFVLERAYIYNVSRGKSYISIYPYLIIFSVVLAYFLHRSWSVWFPLTLPIVCLTATVFLVFKLNHSKYHII